MTPRRLPGLPLARALALPAREAGFALATLDRGPTYARRGDAGASAGR